MIHEALKSLEESLKINFPMGVPRAELGRATGNILHPRTQANRDSAGCGIDDRFRVGRSVVYTIPGVLRQIRQQMTA